MTQTDTVSQLRAVLCDESANLAVRFRALFSLKHLATQGDVNAIDAIAAAFSSDSGKYPLHPLIAPHSHRCHLALLKHELAYCLGQSSSSHAVPYLQRVLSNLSEDPMVRHEAGEALGALGHTDSLPLLRSFLTDPSPEVRETCEIAIERIEWLQTEQGQKEAKAIKSAFTSIDPAPPLPPSEADLNPAAAKDTKDHIDTLQQKLTDPSFPLFKRYRAMFSLRDLVPTQPSLAIPALASGFSDSSALFRHEVAFVFGQLAHPDSVPFLVPVAGDANEHPMVRHEAVEALGSVGIPEVDEILKNLSKDGERVVRESAVVALDMAEWERSGELEYALIPEGAKKEVVASV